jgi:hypothetical protein
MEQTKLVEERSRDPLDRSFVHEVKPETLYVTEYTSRFDPPKTQKVREFRSERRMDKDPAKKDHYIQRWTRGDTGVTLNSTVHRDFWTESQ